MRPADPPPSAASADAAYVARLAALAHPYGITHTGVAPAAVLTRAREAIHQRLADGLVADMQFTFKHPERSTDPGQAVRGAQSVFVAARPYLLAEPPPPAPAELPGRIARYAWLDHYAPLREGLWAVTRRLRADGWKAVPFADDNSIVDREVAHLAGLGWFGKNANLLLPGAGSWFVLGCVVTTAPLPVAAAPVADGCGTCRRCLDACPTGAILAPGVVDAGQCLAWALQRPGIIPRHLRAAVGDRLYGCDDCQEVCPPSVRFGPRHMPATDQQPAAWLPVLQLLSATDDELLATWGRWYLADRDPRWVRRNALIVLGNTGLGGPATGGAGLGTTGGAVAPATDATPDARVQRVLADYLAHSDPMLRAHAVWAAQQLGLHHLMPATDPHPDVQSELQAVR
ncbi:MAG: 4Fe-4S double cluster binding domain-containing protein [Actinomycetota bacterium]|nr:4Fe-4S double cluster binding domain-containing protein [Actinomycetota bacterium]